MAQNSKFVLFIVAISVLGTGCKSRDANQAPGAMLSSGLGAVLVSFPTPDLFRRTDWMCQVNLEGAADTRALPRIPFSDMQSVVILNVPPGRYSASAFAWQRGMDPAWGGTSDSVIVQPGKLTTLRAKSLGVDIYPYQNTALRTVGMSPWDLPKQEDLSRYIASALRETVKG